MNVEIREDGTIVLRNGNKEFKFQNMGEFIGTETRNPDEPIPVVYKLMASNEEQPDGVLHIEALIDPIGNYSRLIISKNLAERIVGFQDGIVMEDKVFVMGDSNTFVPKDTYIAYEDDFENHRTIEEYFDGKEKKYISDDGQFYKGEVTKDSYVTEFLQSAYDLSHTVYVNPEPESGEMRV